MSNLDEEANLESILHKVQNTSVLLPEELNTLVASFATDRNHSTDQAKSYLTLSLFCHNIRQSHKGGKDQESTNDHLIRTLNPLIVGRLTEPGEESILIGVSFLTALFRVEPDVASGVFAQEGILENIMDIVDLSPSLQLRLAVAHLLSEASGQTKSRKRMTTDMRHWLELMSQKSDTGSVATAAVVALVKLWKGSSNNGPENANIPKSSEVDRWIKMMTDSVIHGKEGFLVLEAVEGLAYLTTDPAIKEILSKDLTFLQHLFALVPAPKASSSSSPAQLHSPLVYGILTIVSNLVTYRRRLSEEQHQLEKLKRMANTSETNIPRSPEDLTFDNDVHVKIRIHRLMEANVLFILPITSSMMDSRGIRMNVGKILLSIIQEKDNRGKVLRSGGARILQLIIRKSPNLLPQSSKKRSKVDTDELEALQALAKLTITSSPVQVYGPDIGAMYDVVRPLSLLIQHPSSDQLQRFEGMMALTNLASYNSELASRIGNVDGLLSDIELLLLEEHALTRRASMELICNLVAGSEQIFERYAGNEENSTGVTSKVQIVLALSDVDDVPTQLAASGTLATLTSSPHACKTLFELQNERRRFLPIMSQLIAPIDSSKSEPTTKGNVGLIHRGVVCTRNFLLWCDSNKLRDIATKDADQFLILREALVVLVKLRESLNFSDAILKPTLEALRVLNSMHSQN